MSCCRGRPADPGEEVLIRSSRLLDPARANLGAAVLLLQSALWSLIGLMVGRAFFPSASIEIALFLLVLPLLPVVSALLDRNREEVYRPGGSRIKANRDLALALLWIFLGIFGTFVLAAASAPGAPDAPWFEPLLGGYAVRSIQQLDFGTPAAVLAHNGRVFGAVFLVALLYRGGGLLLVLGWNASRWGVILSHMALMAVSTGAPELGGPLGSSLMGHLLASLLVVLPHLVLEALAYGMAAMSGVFLSKAVTQYSLRSAIFADVLVRGVLRVAGVGLLLLALSAWMESSWAPLAVAWLFPAAGP